MRVMSLTELEGPERNYWKQLSTPSPVTLTLVQTGIHLDHFVTQITHQQHTEFRSELLDDNRSTRKIHTRMRSQSEVSNMKRLVINSTSSESKPSDQVVQNAGYNKEVLGPKCGVTSFRLISLLVALLMLGSVLFSVSVVFRDPPSDGSWAFAEATGVLDDKVRRSTDGLPQPSDASVDKLYGGLLVSGVDESSCLSRYQSALYRKESPFKPSSYLLSRLRNYEALHKRCGPETEPYKKMLEQLKKGQTAELSDCSYVVWISYSGLGNRILTLASAFIYALLTNRVLLVDPGVDIPDLFCEPFAGGSWFLPRNFPLMSQYSSFDQKSQHCYGNILKGASSATSAVHTFVYLHLAHDYDDQDKLFFCDEHQDFLRKVPWLIMRTDNYFVPSLFLMPLYATELNNLFPQKEAIFHLIGRYLFHPTNSVWGLITRYYKAYLAKADERIGIQIRVFDARPGLFQYILDQILNCTMKMNLLPEINMQDPISTPSGKPKSKAVLMTSLSGGYFEKIRNLYWEHSTATGEIVAVYQPSHEEYQQTEKKMHNRKAWAEMYLLSLTDALVTSSWSTFGYVAQSLGGLKPWILYKSENLTTPDPACQRAMSIEPCFHAPPFYDCKAKTGIDTGKLVPHVRHCEDMSWGLKLVDS